MQASRSISTGMERNALDIQVTGCSYTSGVYHCRITDSNKILICIFSITNSEKNYLKKEVVGT